MLGSLCIKNMSALVVLLELCFLLSLSYLVFQLNKVESNLSAVASDRYLQVQASDRSRHSSDDLTRLARTCTVTGDYRNRDSYYATLAIRNGDIPRPQDYHGIYRDLLESVRSERHLPGEAISLQGIMQSLPYSDEERGLLALSEANSNGLVELEIEAFNAMEGRFQDVTGEYMLENKPDQEQAVRLLHSEDITWQNTK